VEFLREGFRAVERNWRIVALYTLSIMVVGLAQMTLFFLQRNDLMGLGEESLKRFTEFGSDLVVVALGAAIQSVAFGALGKEIDKPLYKIGGSTDALKRFFTMWLLLNLVIWLLVEWVLWAGTNDHPTTGLALLFFWLWSVSYLPIGACIMFSGTTEPGEIGNSLAPLGRFFPGFLAVALLLTVEFFFGLYFAPSLAPQDNMSLNWIPGWSALLALSGLIHCAAFAAVWEICRAHRDQDEETDDFDF